MYRQEKISRFYQNASEECEPVPLKCNKESGAERAMSMRTRRWKR